MCIDTRLVPGKSLVDILGWLLALGALSLSLYTTSVGMQHVVEDKEISAERLLVKDRHGIVRITLSANDQGIGELLLHDGAAHPRLKISVGTKGASALECLDGKGQTRLEMGTSDGEKPYLAMRSAAGIPRVSLSYEDAVSLANLSLFDSKGRGKIGLSTIGETEASLAFERSDGSGPAITLGVASSGIPGIDVFDPSRKSVARMGLLDRLGLGFFVEKGDDLPIQLGLDAEGEVVLKLRQQQKKAPQAPVKKVISLKKESAQHGLENLSRHDLEP